jgi:hypothetical protein
MWGAGDLQSDGEGVCLELLYVPPFLIPFLFSVLFVAVVPVDVLVLLPPACGGVDAVAEIVLRGGQGGSGRRETHGPLCPCRLRRRTT